MPPHRGRVGELQPQLVEHFSQRCTVRQRHCYILCLRLILTYRCTRRLGKQLPIIHLEGRMRCFEYRRLNLAGWARNALSS
jgi:hypothetical protein